MGCQTNGLSEHTAVTRINAAKVNQRGYNTASQQFLAWCERKDIGLLTIVCKIQVEKFPKFQERNGQKFSTETAEILGTEIEILDTEMAENSAAEIAKFQEQKWAKILPTQGSPVQETSVPVQIISDTEFLQKV